MSLVKASLAALVILAVAFNWYSASVIGNTENPRFIEHEYIVGAPPKPPASSDAQRHRPRPPKQNGQQQQRQVVARTFDPWPVGLQLPCFPADHSILNLDYQDKIPLSRGLMYLNPIKAASSIAASIQLRLALTLARPRGFQICDNRFSHGSHPDRGALMATRFRLRDYQQSFLWTMLREPTARFVSEFFLKIVSQQRHAPSMPLMREFGEKVGRDYYLRSLSVDGWHRPAYSTFVEDRSAAKKTSASRIEVANQILLDYDFVGVTERFDESVVVLMMLLGLPVGHGLYFSAKATGGFDGGYLVVCHRVQSSKLTEDLQAYLQSDEFQKLVKYDRLLYDAANASLDRTMDRLGRQRVQQQLALFQRAQALAAEECADKVRLPCYQEGRRPRPESQTDCLFRDMGCGMECLDQVATSLGIL